MTSAPIVVPLPANRPRAAPSSSVPGGADNADQRDAELAARIRAGDSAAFETVFHMYTRQLCAFAFRYVDSRDTAAELVQDVFLRIWRQRSDLELRGTLRAYLYRAVRNCALDVLKHAAVERRWAEAEVEADDRTAMSRMPAPPDRVLEIKTLATALDAALAELPERRRQIFLLRWKYGMSYAEIGEELGITPKTVENQLGRVLHFLRARFGPERG